MINQNGTWKLRWKILALCAVLLLGAATLTNAQEGTRTVAEIQADINALQAELRETRAAEQTTAPNEDEQYVVFHVVPKADQTLVMTSIRVMIPEVVAMVDGEILSVIGRKAEHEKVKEILAQLEKARMLLRLYATGRMGVDLDDAYRLVQEYFGFPDLPPGVQIKKQPEPEELLAVTANAADHAKIEALLRAQTTGGEKPIYERLVDMRESAFRNPARPAPAVPLVPLPGPRANPLVPARAVPPVTPVPRGAFSQAFASVTAESAQDTALASVGGGTVARVETKYPKHGMEYKVIVVHGNYRYDVHVSALTGNVVSLKPHLITRVYYNAPGAIDVETAKSIAIQSAGGGVVTECKLEHKKREGMVYSIKVANGQFEHSVELLAATGTIYKMNNKFKP